jgi:phosphohistidine phosphatase SixA
MAWNSHLLFITGFDERFDNMLLPLRFTFAFKAIKTTLLTSLLAFVWPVMAADFADVAKLADLLKGQQYVLMLRHADAPGIGDPAGYSLKDCATQRNLGQRGRQQSVEIGQWLKAQGVLDALVLTSPWCRARDTGTGMAVGEVKSEESLGSFFDDRSMRESQNSALQAVIRERVLDKGARPLILVSHQVNISEFSGEYLASGAMLLVKIDAQGKPVSAQRLSPF